MSANDPKRTLVDPFRTTGSDCYYVAFMPRGDDVMRRREFITLLSGVAAWPLAAQAQQPAIPIVGFLRPTSAQDSGHLLAALRQGLRESGYPTDMARSRRARPKPSVIADKYRVGRVQRQVRRALVAVSAPVSIQDLLAWCYPATKQHPQWHRTNVHRALPRFAISLGRIPHERGRPCVWIPRPELRRLLNRQLVSTPNSLI